MSVGEDQIDERGPPINKRINDRSIKGVFFDAGGTLFDVRGGVGDHYSRLAGRYGVEADPEFLNRRFQEVFAETHPPAFPGADKHEINGFERRWWHQLVRKVFDGISFPAFESFFDDVYRYFEGSEAWILFPETIDLLEDLHKGPYYIGIISNFDSRLESVCQSLGIRHYFKAITLSSRQGVAKPSPEIFNDALKEAALLPSESIFVGDSLDNDIPGALAIGMFPLLVDREGRYPGREGLDRISDLRGVLKYLF
ncbi:MAG: HAD-IIIA family hydrolase [Nitrospiria bacterium]